MTDFVSKINEHIDDPIEVALRPELLARAIRAVLDLHARKEAQRSFGDRRSVCKSCDDGRSVPVWPCPTVLAVARGLGVSDGGHPDHMTETPTPPKGYRWVWMPSRELPHELTWELVPSQAAKRCRWTERGVRCPHSSVARLDRARVGADPRWWHYCGEHLFGRRVVDGQIEVRILAPEP